MANMLQLNESVSGETILEQTSEDLGIDSLNAVDLRTWFVKEVKVDIPVLRILGGATLRDILLYSFDLLSVEVAPAKDPNFQPETKIQSQTNISDSKIAQYQASKPRNPDASVALIAKSQHASHSNLSAVTPTKPQEQESSLDRLYSLNNSHSWQSTNPRTSPISTDGSYDIVDAGTISDKTALDRRLSPNSTNSAVETKIPTSSTFADLDYIRTCDLSYGQARFWFLQSYVEDKSAFNITCSFDLTGKLNVERLRNAVETVGQRHEALRTCLLATPDGKQCQRVLAKSNLRLEEKTFRSAEDLARNFEGLKEHVYDLSSGEIMRVILLLPSESMSSTEAVNQLLIGYHHINMDGVSLSIILNELELVYKGQALNRKVLQYPDFAARQKQLHNSGAWRPDIEYWQLEFGSPVPVLPLFPFAQARPRSVLRSYDHVKSSLKIDGALTKQIQTACNALKISPFHFFTATFHAMLSRWSKVDEVVLGFTDANRYESDLENSVGLYLNVLPLKLQYSPDKSFAISVKETRKKIIEAVSHSSVPIDIILDELQISRSASHNPLFQACINYRPAVNERRAFHDCFLEGRKYESGRTSYDLLLDIIDSGNEDATVILSVQESLYDQHAADTLIKSFIALVEDFSQDPSQTLSQPSLFSAADVQQAINLGTGKLFSSLKRYS
jgi:hybrid polyketide synthase/nonribosomal peptide synthetase ACE1